MSFAVSIPIAGAETANATLLTAGWGPDNLTQALRRVGTSDVATHAFLFHLGTDAAFQAACAALPGAVLSETPGLTSSFLAHMALQNLERVPEGV